MPILKKILKTQVLTLYNPHITLQTGETNNLYTTMYVYYSTPKYQASKKSMLKLILVVALISMSKFT